MPRFAALLADVSVLATPIEFLTSTGVELVADFGLSVSLFWL